MALYTFGLVYRSRESITMIEEIDVHAPNPELAKRMALDLAAEDYEPGWDEMIEMPAGGSGGTIQSFGI